MITRTLLRIIPSVPASDGAGVKLRRSLGQSPFLRHDPFLLLDEFFSDDPDDYIRGFPAHPHRGFETVTYMLDGHMRHEDSAGHRGDLGPGDVQWMTAGRGIIHSEIPQQTAGRMRGFQLWINLPAAEKMIPATYRDIPSNDIPVVSLAGGGLARVIAGSLTQGALMTVGPIQRSGTQPYYWDVQLAANEVFEATLPAGHNVLLYVYEGRIGVGEDAQHLPPSAVGILSEGGAVRMNGDSDGARVLVLAGKPIDEPIVQYGPFVMNSREEIEQALADYRDGILAT